MLVRDAMKNAFPDLSAAIDQRASAYMADLVTLDQEFSEGLASCTTNKVVANHDAYGYMEMRYDLEFTTVHGIDPEGEPTQEMINEAIAEIREEELTHFFVEEYTNERAVASITSDTDVTTHVLYTMEVLPTDRDMDYFALMRANLEGLKLGLGCSA